MHKFNKIILGIFVFFLAWNLLNITIKTPSTQPKPIQLEYSNDISAKAAYAPGDVGYLTSSLNGTNGNLDWFKQIYSLTRGLLNLGLFAFLVYIAMRNILNLGVDSYGIKRMLPRLIVAAFLGNLIAPAIAIASRVVDSLFILKIFEPSTLDWFGLIGTIPSVGSGAGLAVGSLALLVPALASLASVSFIIGFLALLIIALMLIMCLLLSLFLALRPWIILIGAAIGPLAIACYVLPETEGLFKKWSKIILFWLLYPLIIYAITYLAKQVPSSLLGGVNYNPLSSIIAFILPLVIKIILFFTVVRAPFAWEKDIGGFLQSLPQTVSKGVSDLNRANRAAYGYLGTSAYQKYRKEGMRSQDRAKRKAIEDGVIKQKTDDWIDNDDEGKASVKTKKLELLRDAIKNEASQKTLDALGGNMPKLDQLRSAYDRFLRNPRAMARSGAKGDRELAELFGREQNGAEDKAKKIAWNEKAAALILKAGQEGERNWRDSRRAKALMFQQSYLPSGLSTYLTAMKESFAKDTIKMEYRYNKPVQLLARFSPEPYFKNHVERKQSDHKNADGEEQLMKEVGKKPEFMAKVKAKKYGIDDEDLAAAVMAAELREFDTQAETAAVYTENWLGKKSKIKFIDPNTGEMKEEEKTIDADMLATNVSAFEKERQLSASAARSIRAVEEQRYLREQQQNRFWQAAATSPSAAIGNANQPVSEIAQAPISPAERKIIQGLDGIRNDIKSSSGVEAINRLNGNFANINFDDVTEDHYANLYFRANATSNELGDHLMAKAGNDPALKGLVTDFINELNSSRGLQTTALIEKAESRFGKDAEVERLIEDFSVDSQMKLVIEQKNPEAIRMIDSANKFSQRAQQNPNLISSTQNAINIYMQNSMGNQSIPPQEIDVAKQKIAEQFGLSDGGAVTKEMAKHLAEQIISTTIRNPETE